LGRRMSTSMKALALAAGPKLKALKRVPAWEA
jgi:hypothetical protein